MVKNSDYYLQSKLEDQIWLKEFSMKSKEELKPQSKLSSYEKLSFLIMFASWGLLILVVSSLHFGNYHLETKTSSTSTSHSSFSK